MLEGRWSSWHASGRLVPGLGGQPEAGAVSAVLPLPTVELFVHAHTRFRGWRREPVWLSDSTRSLLLVASL